MAGKCMVAPLKDPESVALVRFIYPFTHLSGRAGSHQGISPVSLSIGLNVGFYTKSIFSPTWGE